MRRLPALLAAALLAGCAVTPPVPQSPSASPSPSPTTQPTPTASPTQSPTPTPTPPPQPACRAEAEALSVAERAGQLVMVGVTGSLDATEKSALTKLHVGSVILMGTSSRGVGRTAALTDSIQDLADDIGILVGVDQEGGSVQRLKGSGFDNIPSAAAQAKLTAAELTQRATGWGEQLANAGVHLNLAPVADVVPADNAASNEPIARLGRGYGSDPAQVSARVAAFVAGMHAGGVGAAVKHFPGLGAVKGNTDFAADVRDTRTTADSDLLIPFRDALASADAVMVASAIYTRIDADSIAAFSPKVVGLLRGWGYDKVVISDDLGAAVALKAIPAKERAVNFVEAGGDLAVTVDPTVAAAMVGGLVDAASNAGVSERLTQSAARVLALKQDYGLVTCR